MAKWVNSDVLDLGLTEIKTDANSMRLLSAYTAGDTYSTVNTNSIAAVAMTGTDYTLGTGGSSSRTLTTASGKSATASASSGGTPNLHIAFVDTATSRVLWVTDETSDQVVTSGNTVNFPALVYTASQPT
jgi:enoyl reductase-like protein